jgi:hypothetical protein
MKTFFQKLARFAGALRRSECGSASVEFVLVLPAFMLLFTSAYEGGVLSTRQVMLERGVDATVREVRIGRLPFPNHESLSDRICHYAAIIPDCKANLRVEMIKRNPRAWVAVPTAVQCVDRAEQGIPVINFNPGLNNELMILRVCALFDPMIPTTGLGREIPKESGGAYALVATSSYVMEPFQ